MSKTIIIDNGSHQKACIVRAGLAENDLPTAVFKSKISTPRTGENYLDIEPIVGDEAVVVRPIIELVLFEG